jgi:hypothetical protein
VTESASGQGSLPTRERVIELRDFIHGRTYAAVALTIRVDGEPPHAPESDLARVAEASQALYQVTSHLCSTLLRRVMTLSDPQFGTPRVLGVDDFAIRRG